MTKQGQKVKSAVKILIMWKQSSPTTECFYQLYSYLPVLNDELTSQNYSTKSCCLSFLSFDSFFLQSPQVWVLGKLKELSTTSLQSSLCTPTYTAANEHSYTFAAPAKSEWCNHKMIASISNGKAQGKYIIAAWKLQIQNNALDIIIILQIIFSPLLRYEFNHEYSEDFLSTKISILWYTPWQYFCMRSAVYV